MRSYARVVFGLNAVFQAVVGFLCLLAPETAIGVFGGGEAEQANALLLVAFRVLGVNLIPSGVVSALIAGNPDGNTVFRALMGLGSVLTFVCGGIVFSDHEVSTGQVPAIALALTLQALVIVGVVFYNPKAKGPALFVTTRRRAAA